jgi:hypothetical protein
VENNRHRIKLHSNKQITSKNKVNSIVKTNKTTIPQTFSSQQTKKEAKGLKRIVNNSLFILKQK